MKKLILIISTILLLAFNNTNAQLTNLVTNGDFEIYSALPDYWNRINNATGWYNTNLYCGLYSYYSQPDYYYSGAFMPLYPGSFNYIYGGPNMCAILPFSGNGEVGLLLYQSEFYQSPPPLFDIRNYIGTQLNSTMISGKKYIVSFYLTNGNNSIYTMGCNNFAINFSTYPLYQPSAYGTVINASPQLKINSIIYSNYWQNFRFKYTPDSSYNYITIGNFNTNLQTLTNTYFPCFACPWRIFSDHFVTNGAYYFIDKIEIYPGLEITGTANLCRGNSSTLKINYTDSIVHWKDTLHPNIIIATDSMLTVSPTVSTTYMAISSFDTAYFTVNVHNPSVVNLGNDTTLCQGDTLQLNATIANAFYIWQDYSTNPTYTVTQTGTYWVKVMSDYCTIRDTINITYNLTPLVNLGNDTTLCYGQTLTLNASFPNATYLWQNGSTNAIFTVAPPYTPNVFYVKATLNNCSGYDTITISYTPAPIKNFYKDTVVCNGESILLDVSNPNSTYVWQDNTTNSTYNVTHSGIYSVSILMDGCIFKDTIQVVISPPLTVNLGSDTTVCLGNVVTLEVNTPNTTYQWQNGATVSTYTVSQQGVYWVKVTDIYKCSASDTIIVYYNDCDTSNIIIPNIFTPNGDGYNDYFVLKNTEYKTIEVQIYNRWGLKVFEDTNYKNTWDGKYNGNPLADGTYYYIIKSKGIFNKKEENYNGSVTILR